VSHAASLNGGSVNMNEAASERPPYLRLAFETMTNKTVAYGGRGPIIRVT